jgi:hypothetical protein
MSSGTRSLGVFLDNWLDMTSFIIQSALGLDTGLQCDGVSLALTPLNRSSDVFGSNKTVVVGLTRDLYAITDGNSVQYFSHRDTVRSIIAIDAWPIQVDTSLGIAAVSFLDGDGSLDNDGAKSTSMMGCRCENVDQEMRIVCAILQYEGDTTSTSEETRVFDVSFQQRSTAGQMSCMEADISVQSVRWPVTRFVSAVMNKVSCFIQIICK